MSIRTVVGSALALGVLAIGCSSGSSGDDVEQANGALGVANVNVPYCSPAEQTIFSCDVEGGKALAVCAKNVTSPSGYIEYRFGSPNRSEATLTYPSQYEDESDPAPYRSLTFNNGDWHYKVYLAGGAQPVGGVFVLLNDDYRSTVNCVSRISSFDIQPVIAAGVRLDVSNEAR